MNTKYKLTKNTRELFGKTLYQIEALKNFGNVSKGELGGYIEAEKNLSVSGNAWVSGDAWVYGDAWVSGNAWVSGDAWVYGDAWVSGDAWVYGNAWVYGDARVYGDAWVYGNARVYGDAWVYGDARVYGELKLEAGFFFGVKWSGEKIQEIEIENSNYLIYKGDAKFGEVKAEIEEMTMEDVCKALGKVIKIKK